MNYIEKIRELIKQIKTIYLTNIEFSLIISGMALFCICFFFKNNLTVKIIISVIGALLALLGVYKQLIRKNKASEINNQSMFMLFTIAVIFIVMAVIFLSEFHDEQTKDPAFYAAFGDYIGGFLNPIVAICALVALIQGLKIQQSQLNTAREDVKKAQELAQRAQELAQKTQEREQDQYIQQRFFDWMSLYRDVVYQIEIDVNSNGEIAKSTDKETQKTSGKKALERLLAGFIIDVSFNKDLGYGYGNKLSFTIIAKEKFLTICHPDTGDVLIKTYESDTGDIIYYLERFTIFNSSISDKWNNLIQQASQLSAYFRIVQNFLIFAQVEFGEKRIELIKIFRDQLSEPELILLAANMLFNKHETNMVELANKFTLLEHIPEQYIFLNELIRRNLD